MYLFTVTLATSFMVVPFTVKVPTFAYFEVSMLSQVTSTSLVDLSLYAAVTFAGSTGAVPTSVVTFIGFIHMR